jgi:di/tricarboxylate transporter
MTGETLFVFGLLLVTIILFVSDRLRLDGVAMLVILVLMLSGLLSPGEALAGFGDPVVLLIAGLFVVGEALLRTGIAYAVGNWLMRVAGTSQTRLLVLLMLTVASLSAFMSSTGAVAIFIPIALGLAGKVGLAPSRIMMPMAFAALIGGMLTLIGTPPNLVVSTQLERAGLAPFGFFSFTPIGLLVLVIGIGYLVLIGQRLLPIQKNETGGRARHSLIELAEAYGLKGNVQRLRITEQSPLVGQTLAQLHLRTRYGVTVLGLQRQQGRRALVLPALGDTEFQSGDILIAVEYTKDLEGLVRDEKLEMLPFEDQQREVLIKELGLAEVLLTPRSELIGRTLIGARFRTQYGLGVVGIMRKGKPLTDNLGEITLVFGDSLLVAGGWEHISRLQGEQTNFFVLTIPEEMDEVAPNRSRAPTALLILVAMLVIMTLNLVPAVTAVLLAAAALVLTRCLSMNDAYGSINWESLVLIAGMLPMATALEKTGGVEIIVNGLVDSLGGSGPIVLMAALFVLTSVFSQFMSNTATTVLVAPIALGAAAGLGVSPYPLLMTVALAASTAFATPVASPVNTLILGPGGYRFNDFVKVGVPLQLLAMAVTLLAVPVLFPFR